MLNLQPLLLAEEHDPITMGILSHREISNKIFFTKFFTKFSSRYETWHVQFRQMLEQPS